MSSLSFEAKVAWKKIVTSKAMYTAARAIVEIDTG